MEPLSLGVKVRRGGLRMAKRSLKQLGAQEAEGSCWKHQGIPKPVKTEICHVGKDETENTRFAVSSKTPLGNAAPMKHPKAKRSCDAKYSPLHLV